MKTFVMIPTYNEAKNIRRLIPEVLQKVPKAKIVVVDDNSPDGTANEVRKLRKKYPRQIHLLIRKKARGRGTAGIAGFEYALNRGAEVMVEMDADFSHNPRYLPSILDQVGEYDVVLGSRFVSGGEDRRGVVRHLITIFGNFYIRKVLKLSIRDCTSGYRAFRREVFHKVNLESLISVGPSIVQEILYKAALFGYRIKEVPIIFVDRRQGKSKFNNKIMLQGILMVLVLRLVFTDVWKKSTTRHD
jgi:dolichol-phosphate mannosyltransferase